MVMTSRVEGDPLDAAWRASCRGTLVRNHRPWTVAHDEALSLAGSFIDATQRVALACIERAGGNPLFLEQLLRNAEEGREDAVPPSVQSLVLARMDRLPARDRQAFQAAAVIGQRFGLAAAAAAIGDPTTPATALVGNALVLPEGDDFLFAHALIQEGAYASLLRSRRREMHLRAAEWFADRDLMLHAQHLDRAEDDRAPQAYLQAALAQRAAIIRRRRAAAGHSRVAIARTDADRHALICLKGDFQRDLGDIAASIATYRRAVGRVRRTIRRAAGPNSGSRKACG